MKNIKTSSKRKRDEAFKTGGGPPVKVTPAEVILLEQGSESVALNGLLDGYESVSVPSTAPSATAAIAATFNIAAPLSPSEASPEPSPRPSSPRPSTSTPRLNGPRPQVPRVSKMCERKQLEVEILMLEKVKLEKECLKLDYEIEKIQLEIQNLKSNQ